MRKSVAIACGSLFLLVVTQAGMVRSRADEPSAGGTALFNGKNLAGWYTFIRHNDKSIDPKTDPKGVFKVENGVIHVSGEEFGCLMTEKEYGSYHLTLEFKWGDKKWPPRLKDKRDSGVLVHCVPPDNVWPKSIECQIQEGDCGDFYLVGGTTIVVDGQIERGRRIKTKDAEKPNGQWNTIEVICDGDKVTNIVNGQVVNAGKEASVTKGKILLQSEGAEVFYRNISFKPVQSKERLGR